MMLIWSIAFAGKMDQGFRGMPWGDATVLDALNSSKCARNPHEDVTLRCSDLIGDIPVIIDYGSLENVFYAVMVTCTGKNNCMKFYATLAEAYTPCTTQYNPIAAEHQCMWNNEKHTFGSWIYYEHNQIGTFTVFNVTEYQRAINKLTEKGKSFAAEL